MVKCVICTCIFPVRKYLNAIFFYYHSVGKENYTRRCHLKGYRQKLLLKDLQLILQEDTNSKKIINNIKNTSYFSLELVIDDIKNILLDDMEQLDKS